MIQNEEIRKRLHEVAVKKGLDPAELEARVEAMKSTLTNIPEHRREEYAARLVIVKTITQPPRERVEFIPLGYSRTRETSLGTTRDVIVLTKEGLNRLLIKGENFPTGFSLFTVVEAEVGKFNDGTFIASGSDVWKTKQTVEPIELIKRVAVKSTIHEAKLSRTVKSGGSEFYDPLDLRWVQGFITRTNKGEWGGLINISDGSVIEEELRGDLLIPVELPVWVDRTWVKYPPESEVIALGTLRKSRKDGSLFMEGIAIIPIFIPGGE